jgi:hydroxymethylbilane synthase
VVEQLGPGPIEIVVIKTSGDRLAHTSLAEFGGKALFVKEIEEALLDRQVDFAVHSLKDLPAEVPSGLSLVAFPQREDPRDVLVSRHDGGIESLPKGAVVGTGSLRRRVQLLARRPDLAIKPIRGNVDTRLRKLSEEGLDAVIVAGAGLNRLNLTPAGARWLPPEDFIPAVGQGILAVESREGDRKIADLLAGLDHVPTRLMASAERAFLLRIGGGCRTPLAAHAVISDDGAMTLMGMVASLDGRRMIRSRVSGAGAAAERLGEKLAEELNAQGAQEILEDIRQGA